MMRLTYFVATLLLIMTTEILGAKKCKEYKYGTCSKRNKYCPNTYKCVAKDGKCCQYKLPKYCEVLIKSETKEPWKCRGGRSARCPDGYVCHSERANRYSVCCEECYCKDDLGNTKTKTGGPWTESDGCTKCTCESGNKKKCDNKKCKNSCKSYGSYSPFSPCPQSNMCGKKVQIKRCNSALRTQNDPQPFQDVEQVMKTCYPNSSAQCPQPGIALTEIQPIIINTNDTEVNPEHNYRWMVHIDKGKCRCGGTILSPRHILTAAHCLVQNGLPISGIITVKTGKHKISDLGEPLEQTRIVRKSHFKIHENFDPTLRDGFDNDIAILLIDKPLDFNNHTQPIKLPTDTFNKTLKNLKKGFCKVIGWGDTAGKRASCTEFKYSDVLLEAEINLENDCTMISNEAVTDNMFCASAPKMDSCFGDSGGPLMCRDGKKWYQHGIVSWGPAESCGNGSGVYTKVANYIDWIKDKISTPGGWGEWSEFTSCSASCGSGIKSRVRACTDPEPIGNGICPDFNHKTTGGDMLQIDEQPCNTEHC